MTKTTRRIIEYAICPRCQGQGQGPVNQFEWQCEVCHGTGKIAMKEEITEETSN